MKIISTKMKVLLLSILALAVIAVPQAFAEGETSSDFTVGRFVVSEGIAEREPVGVTNTFSVDTPKAYCFLEARDIADPTEISFVWYYQDAEVARVTLALGKSARWRTYSSKNIAGFPGTWKVEVQDINGTVMDTVDFTVE